MKKEVKAKMQVGTHCVDSGTQTIMLSLYVSLRILVAKCMDAVAMEGF